MPGQLISSMNKKVSFLKYPDPHIKLKTLTDFKAGIFVRKNKAAMIANPSVGITNSRYMNNDKHIPSIINIQPPAVINRLNLSASVRG